MVSCRPTPVVQLLCALSFIGCATSAPQLPQSRSQKLILVVAASAPIGNVLPVQVVVTNRKINPIKLQVEQIRAGRADGSTVGVLLPDQAKEAAGGADRLIAALAERTFDPETGESLAHRSGPQSELATPVVGCLYGFVNWSSLWPLACPVLVVRGITRFATSAAVASSSSLQVNKIALSSERVIDPGDLGQGYIFLPRGDYTTIEMPVTDLTTEGRETIVQPWDSAAQLAAEAPVSSAPMTIGNSGK